MDDHFEESVKTRATKYHNLVHFATLKMITGSPLSNSVPLACTGYAHTCTTLWGKCKGILYSISYHVFLPFEDLLKMSTGYG